MNGVVRSWRNTPFAKPVGKQNANGKGPIAQSREQELEREIRKLKGAVYTSYDFQRLAKEKGIVTSMSRKGTAMTMPSLNPFTPR